MSIAEYAPTPSPARSTEGCASIDADGPIETPRFDFADALYRIILEPALALNANQGRWLLERVSPLKRPGTR